MNSNKLYALMGTCVIHGTILLLHIIYINNSKLDHFGVGGGVDYGYNSISLQMLQNIRVEQEPESSQADVQEHKIEKTNSAEVAEITAEKTVEVADPKAKKIDQKPQKRKTSKPKLAKKAIKAQDNINAKASNINSQNNNAKNISNGNSLSRKSAYLTALRKAIESKKFYPQRAKLMRKQGVVIVEIHISPTGQLQNVWVKTSSGNNDLDRAAISAVEQAKFVGKPPAGIDEVITIPISFTIQ